MKNILFTSLFLSLMLTSCSNESIDDTEENNDAITITNYIYKTYNVSNAPNTIIDSTNYLISNNRILSSSSINLETLDQQTSIYSYFDNRIDGIQSFRNGTLNRIQSYTYNANSDLIEYLSESINTSNQASSFEKHTFNHTTDTIFSSWKRSNDGINFNTNVTESKTVIDANNNRTYFEEYDYFNDETDYHINSYDSNNNMLSDRSFLFLSDGSTQPLIENNHTFSSNINLYNLINEKTFSRKNLMVLYHLQSTAINNFNAKSVSPNALDTFTSSASGNIISFEIANRVDSNNLAITSEFRTLASGQLFSRFLQEFLIEN